MERGHKAFGKGNRDQSELYIYCGGICINSKDLSARNFI
jgi:hypothetical protein